MAPRLSGDELRGNRSRSLAPEVRRRVFGAAVAAGLAPVSAAAAGVYALLVVAHGLLLPDGAAGPMIAVAAVSSALFAAICAWQRRRPVPAEAGEPVMVALFAIPAANVAVHAWFLPTPTLATHLTALAVGAGILLLSRRWVGAAFALVALGWVAVVVRAGRFDGLWQDASWGLGFGMLLGLVANAVRRKHVERLELVIRAQRELEEELRARDRQARERAEILRQLALRPASAGGSAEDLFRHASETAASALGVARVGVWLFQQDPPGLVCRDLFLREQGRHESGAVVLEADFPDYFRAAREERAIAASDARRDPRTRGLSASYLTPLGIGAMLDAPIRSRGRLVGVVCHEHVGGPRCWSADDIAFAASVAEICGVAIESARAAAAEAERERLTRRMHEARRLESLGLLAGGVAHDFNNVLMAMLGNAELLLAELPPGELRESAEEILRAGRRGAELAEQMLAYSGRTRISASPLDLTEIAREQVELSSRALPPGVSLEFRPGSAPATGHGDATQIRQVVANLVSNAIDAVAATGGRVALTTGSCRDVLAAGDEPGGGEAREVAWLEVSDDGPGMDEPTLERIFDPFFTTKFKGRGLGLAAALGIVRVHEGALRVQSRPGAGTTFRLLLPFRPPPATEAARPPRRAHAPAAGWGTVLVVDDEPGVRRVTARVLASAGYRVVEADGVASGRDRFRELSGGALRAAVLDLTMPDGSGEELARELWDARPDLPVLFLTGYDEAAVRVAGDPDSSTAVLHKPCGGRELLGALEGLLARAEGGRVAPRVDPAA